MFRRKQPLTFITYAAKYAAFDFVALVEHLDEIESNLLDDVYGDVLAAFEGKAEIKGDLLVIGGIPYRISVESRPGTRLLEVLAEPLEKPSPRVRSRATTERINEFGRIARITTRYPAPLAYIMEPLADGIRARVLDAYISLESAYANAYAHWRSSLFNSLYTVLGAQLKVKKRPELANRFWFSLTDLDEVEFRYYLGDQTLNTAIQLLKNTHLEHICPWESATLLVTEEVPDGIFGQTSKLVQLDARTLVIDFTGLPTLGERTEYWLAEKYLFDSSKLAAVDIGEVDGKALQVNCAAEHASEIGEAVAKCAEDLHAMFREGYDEYRIQQRQLQEGLDRIAQARPAAWMREFSIDVIAKVAENMLKH